MSTSLGAKIRKAREGAGLTQAQLAREVGVADSVTVSRWERDVSEPHRLIVSALADRLPTLRGPLGLAA